MPQEPAGWYWWSISASYIAANIVIVLQCMHQRILHCM